MSNLHWFKFYAQDWLIEFKRFDLSAPDQLCYITLLCLAAISNKRGKVENFSEERIIRHTRFFKRDEEDAAAGFAQRLVDVGLIKVKDNVAILPGFKKRQQTQLSGYERIKRHREKVKRNDNADDNAMITLDKSRGDKNREDKKEGKPSLKIPPTLEEVRAYCLERKNGISAQQFIDFYESKGWKVGNQKMKDWKAAVRTWEARRGEVKADPPKKICRECREEAKGGWIQAGSGVICYGCRDKLERSPGKRKLEEMKSKILTQTKI